jgi:GT2 family glycosyltransferase
MTAVLAPTVSVIVPTWNRAAWLPATVESALGQTVPPLEVIVVDDGSTDDTAAVAARLGPWVRYVRQENAGVAAARNTGAGLARGELIAFLDCEDLWVPDKLEIQLGALAACPEVGWSVTDCTVIDLEDNPVTGPQGFRRVFPPFRGTGLAPAAFFGRDLERRTVRKNGREVAIYTGDPFRLLFSGNFGLPSSALVHRELFEKAGGFDPSWRLAEETEFFHRLATVSRVAVVMERLVLYRVGQAGALTSPANTVTLMRNALRSQDQAAALRGDLTDPERNAHAEGRRRLLLGLAWAHLSNHEAGPARAALEEYRSAGGRTTPRSLGIDLLTRLPVPVLRALHRLRRALR